MGMEWPNMSLAAALVVGLTGPPMQADDGRGGAAVTGPQLIHGALGVSWSDHAFSGYIDPRHESSDGVTLDRGISRATMIFNQPVFGDASGGPVTIANFVVVETGGPPPVVSSISVNGATVVVDLSRIITLQQWTTIEANVWDILGNPIKDVGNLGPGVNEPDRIDIGFLPCDVDQSGVVEATGTPLPADNVQWFAYAILPTPPPPMPVGTVCDFTDIDRNLACPFPLDYVRIWQLRTGPPPVWTSTRPWAGLTMHSPQP